MIGSFSNILIEIICWPTPTGLTAPSFDSPHDVAGQKCPLQSRLVCVMREARFIVDFNSTGDAFTI